MQRPALSVVIPTYEPKRFLIEAVKSVLAQDPGSAQMQIAIVDDGSATARPSEVLAALAPTNRIEFYEHAERRGLAGNWNRAIAHARGEYIHILHQDDIVRSGFYAAMLSGLSRRPCIGMAFSRHAFVDGKNRVERLSHRERWRAGVLPHWLDRISERQRIQCPAAVVRRRAYEELGGFRTDLSYALDWEMWVRIASAYEVWYEPRVLAEYRRHAGAESARLEQAGETTADVVSAIGLISTHLPAARRERSRQRAYLRIVRKHAKHASKLCESGRTQAAASHLESARLALAELSDGIAKRWFSRRVARIGARLSNRSSVASL